MTHLHGNQLKNLLINKMKIRISSSLNALKLSLSLLHFVHDIKRHKINVMKCIKVIKLMK